MLIICANNLKQLTNNIYIFIDMRALGGGARRRQCWRAARKLCATGAAARASRRRGLMAAGACQCSAAADPAAAPCGARGDRLFTGVGVGGWGGGRRINIRDSVPTRRPLIP